jgi:hypothetical protein
MKTLKRLAFLQLVLALFLSAASLSAFADPPSRAVRLRYMSGAVSVQPGGVNDWVEAAVNRPLTNADRVWTDQNARAELNLGSASMRMNAETSLTLTNVSDEIVQVELDQGTLNLHIRHLFGGETYEIDTPNQAFTILQQVTRLSTPMPTLPGSRFEGGRRSERSGQWCACPTGEQAASPEAHL